MTDLQRDDPGPAAAQLRVPGAARGLEGRPGQRALVRVGELHPRGKWRHLPTTSCSGVLIEHGRRGAGS